MPTPAPVYLPAPPDMESDQFVHGVTGALITVRVIGFKVTGDEIEPISWPTIAPGSGWEKIHDLGNGYVAAHGRQARNAVDLGNAIKNRRPIQ